MDDPSLRARYEQWSGEAAPFPYALLCGLLVLIFTILIDFRGSFVADLGFALIVAAVIYAIRRYKDNQ